MCNVLHCKEQALTYYDKKYTTLHGMDEIKMIIMKTEMQSFKVVQNLKFIQATFF